MWHVFDPMAETQSSYTPYHYCYNNPVNLVDTFGLDPSDSVKDDHDISYYWRSDGHGGWIAINRGEPNTWNTSEYNYNGGMVPGLTFDQWLEQINKQMNYITRTEGSKAGILADENSCIYILMNNVGDFNSILAGMNDFIFRYSNSFGSQNAVNLGGAGFSIGISLKTTGNIASYSSGFLGLLQIGMIEYRMALPLSSKIGTFSRFSITYSGLSTFSGRLSFAGALIGIGSNINELNSGKIGVGRFTYRNSSIITSMIVGAEIGGPWGAVTGATIGGMSYGFEYIYDNYLVPFGNEVKYQKKNFENAIKNGWYPGR
jgi:hypothetical protein